MKPHPHMHARNHLRARHVRLSMLLASLLFPIACGGGTPVERSTSPTGKPALVVATNGPEVASTQCAEPPNGDEERRRAAVALLAGKPRDANAILQHVLAQNPGDLGAETLKIASQADLAEANARSARALDDETFVMLPELPLAYRLVKPVSVGGADAIRVEKVSLAKNLITDDDDWLKKNGLTPVSRRPLPNDLPEFVAGKVRGNAIVDLFVFDDHQIGVYGDVVAAFAEGKRPRGFDVSRIAKTQGGAHLDVDFAEIVGDVLLLQLSHNGYAREVGGKNAFIAAVGIREGELRWCSEPLVGNSQNFVVTGHHLITGYGFTAEPDFLFVLDVGTGKVEDKQPLQSGPSFLLRKGDRLFVRTYDTDMVFRLTPGDSTAPKATLEDEPASPRARVDAETSCLVDRALARIDTHDPAGLATTIALLRAKSGNDTLLKALSGAQSFLLARAEHPGIDLSTRPIVVMPAPTWEYFQAGVTEAASPAAKESKPPRLVKRKSASADPIRNLSRRDRPDPGQPIFIAPVNKGKLPPNARGDIPSSFGVEDLRAVIPSGDRTILVYGGRYVAIINGTTTEHVFDFETFRHPPKANPQWAEFAVEDVTYAQVEGSVLYVANGGGSYAREVFGKKGFMSAIDLTTNKLIWRSDPLVVDSTFAVTGEFIATGYGFTAEPDWLFLLRRDTGKVATKAHLDTGPETITVRGNLVHVEAYANAYDFEIVR